jgi:hypothetical protein
MTVTRHRRKHTLSFDERLQKAAHQARQEAFALPEGPQRDLLLKKASQAETAAHINEWARSPGTALRRESGVARSRFPRH